jgi:hypothetical protein
MTFDAPNHHQVLLELLDRRSYAPQYSTVSARHNLIDPKRRRCGGPQMTKTNLGALMVIHAYAYAKRTTHLSALSSMQDNTVLYDQPDRQPQADVPADSETV